MQSDSEWRTIWWVVVLAATLTAGCLGSVPDDSDDPDAVGDTTDASAQIFVDSRADAGCPEGRLLVTYQGRTGCALTCETGTDCPPGATCPSAGVCVPEETDTGTNDVF